jgi:hypothetical protein
MGILDDLFGGGKNPADSAMPYYNKIPGIEHNTYDPYVNRGNEAYNNFNPIYQRMSSDPQGFIDSLMGGYIKSKDYQLKNDELTRAAGNTAAAGGMRGSINDIKNQSRITDSLLGEDMQNWLKNVLGVQDRGLQGEQHLYDTGFDASRDLAGDLSNTLGTQGTLAFQGQANQNKSHSDLMEALTKLAAGGAGWYFGGPAGAAVASKFF